MTTLSQAERQDRMRLFLDKLDAAEGELKAALETVSINDERIAEGEQLYVAAKRAIATQGTREADLAEVRADLNTLRKSRTKRFRKQRLRAKTDILEVRVRELLKLDDDIETTVKELHDQMSRFYAAALEHPETQAPLATVAVTLAEIQQGVKEVAEIERLDAEEERKDIAKKEATAAQKAALDAMDAWHDARFEEATFATRHKPELMNALKK